MKTIKKLLAVVLVAVIGMAVFVLPSYAEVVIYKDKESSYSSKDELSTNNKKIVARYDDWDEISDKTVGTYPTSKGVILVTEDALSKGIVGHSAIIYDSKHIVHAVGDGVIVDKNNWKTSRAGGFVAVRVRKTTKAQDEAVADWCYKQVGKPYNIEFYYMNTRDKFYCSHLIWAGYKDLYGIDLNTGAYDLNVPNTYDVHGNVTSYIYTPMFGPYELVPSGGSDMNNTFIIYAQNWSGK